MTQTYNQKFEVIGERVTDILARKEEIVQERGLGIVFINRNASDFVWQENYMRLTHTVGFNMNEDDQSDYHYPSRVLERWITGLKKDHEAVTRIYNLTYDAHFKDHLYHGYMRYYVENGAQHTCTNYAA